MALDQYKVPTPKVKPSNMTDEEWAKIMSQSGVQMPLDGTQIQLGGAYLQNQYGANTAPVSAPAVPTGTTPTATTAPAVEVKPYEEDKLSNYQLQMLDQNRRDSQQMADVTRQRLEKYLPSILNSQGLGGLGVSETAGLQIYNDYQNTMGQIDRDYNTNKMAVVTGQQEKTYDSIQNMIDSGLFPTTDSLENYLNQNKAKLNETQWNELQRYVEFRKTDPDWKAEEEEYKKSIKTGVSTGAEKILSGEAPVEYDGKKYKLKAEDKVENDPIMERSYMKALEKDGYKGLYDKNIPNGYSVRLSYTAYSTYFNGKWYFSEKFKT